MRRGNKKNRGRKKETVGGLEGEVGVEWLKEFDPHVEVIV